MIKKILKEINRLKKELDGYSASEALDYIESYINTLPEEHYKPNYCHHEVDLSDCSEEYRKAYYDGWNNCNIQHDLLKNEQFDYHNATIITKDFTDKHVEEPVNENLEEELNRWQIYHDYPEEYLDLLNFARHFTEWQKQQMMKDAVEAEVFTDYNINFGYGSLTANIDLDEQHLKEGDKVKIIILKTE